MGGQGLHPSVSRVGDGRQLGVGGGEHSLWRTCVETCDRGPEREPREGLVEIELELVRGKSIYNPRSASL